MTILIAIASFIAGLLVGTQFRQIQEKLDNIHVEQKKPRTGVVTPQVNPAAQIKASGVVRPKSPKEVAAENERAFNDKFGI